MGKLQLEDVADDYVEDGPYDPGHTEFKLLADYAYVAKDGTTYTATKGAVINGTSIPKVVWSFVGGPWSGKYRNAAVIHDFLCENLVADSDTVHSVFLESMLVSGVPEIKAKLMYYAVLKGGPRWSAGSGFSPPVVVRGTVSEIELSEFEKILKSNKLSETEIKQSAKD